VPELPEVEAYRRVAATAVGRVVAAVAAPDRLVLTGGLGPEQLAGLVGQMVEAAERKGKLLVLRFDRARLGLHFGMTGRLLADGVSPVGELRYASPRVEPAWIRFALRWEDGGRLEVVDPRRLGRLVWEPDLGALGPDAATATVDDLARALAGRRTPLKACLLDQRRLAGVGNLIADEVLWRAGLDPRRAGGSLEPAAVRRLHRVLRASIEDLLRRGGSHLGDLVPERRPGGMCPSDGTGLLCEQVGGRTTWWCPGHQR
jgi:formamidopyrimidine-DNA glycosylase